MKERPILFSAPMVRAILEGRKTQTRRVVKPQPVSHDAAESGDVVFYGGVLNRVSESRGRNKAAMGLLNAKTLYCPYGVPGDRLWVRETWSPGPRGIGFVYFADCPEGQHPPAWKPSIHMPRAACRITLEVVGVRTERLQEISEADAIAEGVQSVRDHYGDPSIPLMHCGTVAWQRYDGAACAAPSAQLSYQSLWESINGAASWKANPYVWVVEFKRLEAQP